MSIAKPQPKTNTKTACICMPHVAQINRSQCQAERAHIAPSGKQLPAGSEKAPFRGMWKPWGMCCNQRECCSLEDAKKFVPELSQRTDDPGGVRRKTNFGKDM